MPNFKTEKMRKAVELPTYRDAVADEILKAQRMQVSCLEDIADTLDAFASEYINRGRAEKQLRREIDGIIKLALPAVKKMLKEELARKPFQFNPKHGNPFRARTLKRKSARSAHHP